jgi:hypothetical protein
MRTTLSLDPDVAAMLAAEQERTKKPFKQVVNEALRGGLTPAKKPGRKAFKTIPIGLGKCLLPSLDNIGEVLEQIEGPWHK